MYKVMVGEKMNLPKVIFYYWMQVFRIKGYPKSIIQGWNFFQEGGNDGGLSKEHKDLKALHQ